MIRAMWRLRLEGKLDRETYARYKSMLFSGLPIAGLDGTMGTRSRFVIQHFRLEVQRLMVKGTSWDAHYDFAGTIEEWFATLSFDGVVTWLVENWQVIVQVLLGLMVFLHAEYEAE